MPKPRQRFNAYTVRRDGRVERQCVHGVGHPVAHVWPKEETNLTMWIHGCCEKRCCARWHPYVRRTPRHRVCMAQAS